jgi:predicted dehydrogenase
VIGAGMAGQAHAHAYREAGSHRRDSAGSGVRLVAISDLQLPLAQAVSARFGYERAEADWRSIADADDIDIVSVVVHTDAHRELVETLLAAGKHVLCEKPLAPGVADAEAMAAAARAAGRIARVGFSYRCSPAVAAIRELAGSGRFGRALHLSGRYWADHAADPSAPLNWRYRGGPGTGALADIGSHLIDIAQLLCGPIEQVGGAELVTVHEKRLVPLTATVGHQRAETGDRRAAVENEDYAHLTVRFGSGARGVLQVSRVALGHPNTLGFELFCERGSMAYDQGRPGEFQLFDGDGYRRIRVGPEHPFVDGLALAFPGVGVGTNDNFVFQARSFLDEIDGVDGVPRLASFEDGIGNLRVIEAIVRSAEGGGIPMRPGAGGAA